MSIRQLCGPLARGSLGLDLEDDNMFIDVYNCRKYGVVSSKDKANKEGAIKLLNIFSPPKDKVTFVDGR